jgi:hypothetical protein
MDELVLTEADVARLDDLDAGSPGTLAIRAEGLRLAGLRRVAHFLATRGELLRSLYARTSDLYLDGTVDLADLDFALACPHLRTLDMKSVAVNASVFAHPALTTLRLSESDYGGADIAIGCGAGTTDGHALRELEIADCQFDIGTVTVGPASELESFYFSLDEDYMEGAYPGLFEFRDCPRLADISVITETSYTVVLTGQLPRLRDVFLRRGQYGDYKLEVTGVDGDRKAAYLALLREDWD